MAYYVKVDGETVLIATRKADVDAYVSGIQLDQKKTGKTQKITVEQK